MEDYNSQAESIFDQSTHLPGMNTISSKMLQNHNLVHNSKGSISS